MKSRLRMVSTMLCIVTATSIAHAEPHCSPTIPVATSNYPGARVIPTTNNLMQPAGKAVPIEGQQVVITGHVLDSRCMPIPDAVVELWQTDPFGHWYLAEDGDLVNPRPTFAGAGRATTDTDGKFVFITAFPGTPAAAAAQGKKKPTGASAPHVNIRVKATDFAPMNTVLYFANDRRNQTDANYAKLSTSQRASITLAMEPGEHGEVNGTTDIVLPGKVKYRTY